MKVNLLLVAAALVSSSIGLAHDGGHGPKMTESGKFGGVMADIKDKTSASVYKSELVKTSDGKVQLKVYDKAGKSVDLAGWDKVAKATAVSGHKGSKKDSAFELTHDGTAFTGNVPAEVKAPFTLNVSFNEKGKELKTSFANQE